MRALSLMIGMALAALVLGGCGERVVGSGRITTEARQVSGFSTVSVSGAGEMVITKGDREGLRIEAEDNIVAAIESEVRDGTLFIGAKDNASLEPKRSIRYLLTVRSLQGLDISGSVNVTADELRGEAVTLRISGSGNVGVKRVEGGSLSTTLSGSGKATVGGRISTQRATVSGSGEYNAGDLATQRSEVTMSGSGNATVWATESLDATISGNGNISYYGDPVVDQQLSGSGDLRALGGK